MTLFLPDTISISISRHWDGEQHAWELDMQSPDDSHVSGRIDDAALRSAVQQLDVDVVEEHAVLGSRLFDLLFPEPLRSAFFTALGASGERGVRLALRLEHDQPLLHLIPWERLYYKGSQPVAAFEARQPLSFTRLVNTSNPIRIARTSQSMRALVALSNPYPAGHAMHFDEQLERSKIQAALECTSMPVRYVELEKPVTLERLTACLSEGPGFDIFFFSGHGISGSYDSSNEPSLLFESQEGPGRSEIIKLSVLLDKLQPVIHAQQLPELVFLSACHTAQDSTSEALLGFGPKMVEAGCPAVICMQKSVEEQAAREFSATFFQNLLEHGCVDLAVAQARAKVWGSGSWEWAAPVLFTHLADGMLFWPKERFTPSVGEPYKFLSPFSREDADLFHARDAEIEKILFALRGQKLTVVYGPEGIGLTSLMQAGVRPKLEAGNDLVLVISEYDSLANQIRARLWESRLHFHPPLSGDASALEVLQAFIGQGLRAKITRLVLVLDQFERALRLPLEQREAFKRELLKVLGAREEAGGALDILRVILVVHNQWINELVGWQDVFPDLMHSHVEVGPLLTDAAERAINGPLEARNFDVFKVHRMEKSLASLAIPNDLANLYEDAQQVRPGAPKQLVAPGSETEPRPPRPLDPGQLQAVCHWLYTVTSSNEKKFGGVVDPRLYSEAGGSEGILAFTVADLLNMPEFHDKGDLPEKVLVSMAYPNAERWIPAVDIVPEEKDRSEVEAILDLLVENDLLDRQRASGVLCYAFSNRAVQHKAIELGGIRLLKMYGAEAEVDRIWRMWLVNQFRRETGSMPALSGLVEPPLPESRGLATAEQVRTLGETAAHLCPKENKALLLLRSAVYHDQPLATFLGWLSTQPVELSEVRILEMGETETGTDGQPRPSRRLAQNLLGMHNHPSPDPPANSGGFGPVAWCAAAHQSYTSRLTATLALAAVFQEDYPARLTQAMAVWERMPGRKTAPSWRRAEINGGLLDAGFPTNAVALTHLAETEPGGAIEGRLAGKFPGGANGGNGAFWTWLWRFRRRFFRHARRISALVLGSGIANGVVLGLWYFLLELQAHVVAGPFLVLYFFLGFMLGGAIALGIGLAEPILLEDSREPEISPPDWRFRPGPAWLPGVLAVSLSTLAFGLLHALLVILVAVPATPTWHMILPGFAAALGISLGLAGQPRAGVKLGRKGWLARLGPVVVIMAVLQGLPCLAQWDWLSTNFTLSGANMWALFAQYDPNRILFCSGQNCLAGLTFETILSAVHAGIIGLLFVFSSALGMDFALRQLARLRRAGDDQMER